MDNLSHKLIASVTIISIVVQIFDPVVFAVSEFAPYARTLATLGIINPQSSDI